MSKQEENGRVRETGQEYIYTVTDSFLFIKSALYFLYCYTILFIKN